MISPVSILSEKTVFQENDLVCYCFQYSKKDITHDFQVHGYSKILERIKAEKKNKGCHCEVKNPKRR
ncbi:MAG: BFD-like (2Fe-2S) protein [Deltaproteobacteria bacterium]|nr:MAG: BFD-like (2Fe-2S) protein [Deltaproteobacteria bacterium]